MIVRGSNLADSMSAYLVNAIAAQPMIKVHLNTEVVGGHGDGQLEWVTLRERNSGQEQHLPLASLFVMIGARPRTDWLPADVDRDQHGFLYGSRRGVLRFMATCTFPSRTKRLSLGSLLSATCDRARSNGWRPPSEKGQSSSPKSTSS